MTAVARMWHDGCADPGYGASVEHRKTGAELELSHWSGRRESNPHDQLGRCMAPSRQDR